MKYEVDECQLYLDVSGICRFCQKYIYSHVDFHNVTMYNLVKISRCVLLLIFFSSFYFPAHSFYFWKTIFSKTWILPKVDEWKIANGSRFWFPSDLFLSKDNQFAMPQWIDIKIPDYIICIFISIYL